MPDKKTLTLPQMLRKYLRVQAAISSLYEISDELYKEIALQVEIGDKVQIGKKKKILVIDGFDGKASTYRPKRFDKFNFKVLESSGAALT